MTVEEIKKEIARIQDVTKDIKVSVGNLRSDINQLEGAIKQDNDEFEAQLSEAESRGYQRGYEAGFAEGRTRKELSEEQDGEYQRGYRDAWDLATRITLDDPDGGIPMQELKEVFNVGATYRIFKDFDCFEIASKLKEHEKKKAEIQHSVIRVGDEVIAPYSDENGRAVVTKVIPRPNNRTAIEHLYSNGDRGWEYDTKLKKTGRHFDQMEELLKEMRT